jgi:hypothetical protein
MARVEKIDKFNKPNPFSDITCRKCGNIVELVYISKRNAECAIKKISADEYILLSTGEIKEFQHQENRADNLRSVALSLKKLRDYINTNVTDVSKCLWITLTYAENMTDTKRLYKDFDKFIKRFRYKFGDCEYIVACEPQGRGAWHAHFIPIFRGKAPFVPNKELAETWKNGFVKVQKMDDIDNVGAYLTAYLGDFELNDETKTICKNSKMCGEISTVEIDGISKKVVKGGRLYLYPNGFNLFRKSKGIKPPEVETLTELELEPFTKRHTPTFEKAIKVTFENSETGTEDSLIIYYRYYNLKRKEGTKKYERYGKLKNTA